MSLREKTEKKESVITAKREKYELNFAQHCMLKSCKTEKQPNYERFATVERNARANEDFKNFLN